MIKEFFARAIGAQREPEVNHRVAGGKAQSRRVVDGSLYSYALQMSCVKYIPASLETETIVQVF